MVVMGVAKVCEWRNSFVYILLKKELVLEIFNRRDFPWTFCIFVPLIHSTLNKNEERMLCYSTLCVQQATWQKNVNLRYRRELSFVRLQMCRPRFLWLLVLATSSPGRPCWFIWKPDFVGMKENKCLEWLQMYHTNDSSRYSVRWL